MSALDPYARDVVRALWPDRPDPVVTTVRGRPPVGAEDWWILPSPSRARLLVPVGVPGADRMLTRHGGGLRRLARTAQRHLLAGGWLLRIPLPRLRLLRGPSSERGVAGVVERLGGPSASVGVLLGPPRANRKPVLQVFDAAGATAAFVKVGVDMMSAALVGREAAALALLAGREVPGIRAPGVLHSGHKDGLEMLALEALASSQDAARRPTSVLPAAATAALAASGGLSRGKLVNSVYWATTTASAGAVRDDAGRTRAQSLLARVQERYGDSVVVLGSWHGDWAAWNMAVQENGVDVWDWERYDDGVPWGFDVAHFLAQAVRHGSRDRAQAEQQLQARLPGELRRAGAPAEQDACLLLVAYLVTIALRYLEATPVPTRAWWALDLAERVLSEQEAGR